MSNFMEWLRSLAPRITMNFHAPVTLNLLHWRGDKPGKATREPTLLANPQLQAQRRRRVQIHLGLSRRDRLLEGQPSPTIRAGWAAVMKDVPATRKHI